MIGKLKDLMRTQGGEWVVSYTTTADPRQLFDELKDKEVNVEIKKASKKRSKTANDFCWAMCTDIGNAIRPPIPKEEVYRRAIRDVGRYSMMLMEEKAVETFQKIWGGRGIGWFAEVVDDSKKNPGCKIVFAYYGTSTYDVQEMSRVLDYLKQDMDSMGLKIPVSKEEEERMMAAWGRASFKTSKSATSADGQQA